MSASHVCTTRMWWPFAIAAALVWSNAAVVGQDIFTHDTTIDPNVSYDGHDIIVRGCTLTINGAHAFNSLSVQRGEPNDPNPNHPGVVTYGAAFTALTLTVMTNVVVQGPDGNLVGSRLDVSGLGYPAGQGTGAGHNASSANAGGAGYGGAGGNASGASGGAGGPTYGSITEPVDLGSGGGNVTNGSLGGAGGGVLRLTVLGTLTVDGTIRVDGLDGGTTTGYGGGGSGGSIWITCGTLAGAGLITANGGSGHPGAGGGGGGGRIAVYFGASTLPVANIQAYGQAGNVRGGAGTVYRLQTGQTRGKIYIDNGDQVGENTAFYGDTTLDADVVVSRQGRLGPGHYDELPLHLTVTGDVMIDPNGYIEGNGRGSPAGQGTGAGHNASSANAGGAGYGGAGGNASGASGGAGGPTYGSITEPVDLGSGGGNVTNGSLGGAGGGVLRLTVLGTLTVDGTIRVDGLDGGTTTGYGGGGSGGSIWITCGTLAGAGLITANGGSGHPGAGGGGGGGRIAVYFGASTLPVANIQAYGQAGNVRGGAGTVYRLQTGQTRGKIYIDNGDQVGENTAFYGDTTLDADVVVSRQGRLGPGHYDELPLHLTVTGDVMIDPNGYIEGNGRGSPAGQGTGAGHNASSANAGGAGYGGAGGNASGASGGAGGPTYGSITEPVDLGSGGGNVTNGSLGGAGGGVLRLTVLGTLTVDGTIRVDGLDGGTTTGYGGGGSGGSIWITCGTLAGAGLITANGGSGHPGAGGGGGGGRIAVYFGASTLPVANIQAYGQAGNVRGGAGTVYRLQTGQTRGKIYIDNGDQVGENTAFYGDTTLDADVVVSRQGRLGPGHYDELPLHLTVTGDVMIDPNGYIEGNGRGSPAGQGTGAGHNASSANAGGAGYGGAGGNASGASGGAGGPTYGSITEPVDLGSGGGNVTNGSLGGAGGGVLRLTVLGTLTVDGTIRVDGLDGGTTTGYGGGGSGGSIWITCGTLAGAGLITANGGSGHPGAGGGGGGGRIAVYFGASTLPVANIQAYGQAGNVRGGAGTVYRLQTGQTRGKIYIDNGDQVGENTAFYGDTTLDADVVVSRQGRLGPGHYDELPLHLTVTGDVMIDPNGYIEGNGRGSPAGQGTGAGGSTESAEAGGAGYGGAGGNGAAYGGHPGGVGGVTYGSVTAPVDLGSGGGNVTGGSLGGAGGGVLRLTVLGTLTVDGTIRADGLDGGTSYYYGGGGSGGSIWITCSTLAGAGVITANGGSGHPGAGGGGGGGRIAVYFGASTLPVANIRAYGQAGNVRGGAGTVYRLQTGQTRGKIYIDNGDQVGENTAFYGDTTLDADVVVSRQGRLGPGHYDELPLHLTVTGDVMIDPNGYIEGNGRGSPAGQGTGAGGSTESAEAGGAGYGGAGGNGAAYGGHPGGVGGVTYGSVTAPVDLGSGGGNVTGGSLGGAGGGVLRLTVLGTLTVDGTIRADGLDGGTSYYYGGGGSGGSIWITCSTLAGAGVITANGGSGHPGAGGGGGGGRVAVYTCNQQINPANIIANGGLGYQQGDPGTILTPASPYITITQQPVGGITFTGDPLTLTVTASTTHGVLRYQWRKHTPDGGVENVVEAPPRVTGTQTATLRINPARHDDQLDDQGDYDVWLTDDCGNFVSEVAHVIVPPVGDTNCDGGVNFADINPFVLMLSDPNGYQQQYPYCRLIQGDCNGDGRVDFGDINPFVALLSGEFE